MTTARTLLALSGWLALCFAAAALGAWASIGAHDFYLSLQRPPWAPPAQVFGPVWTLLYAMMAVAAWRVWRVGGWGRAGAALRWFVLQLALNALWSWLFFGWHLGLAALLDIVLLWAVLALTIKAFWRWSGLAGALLLPYLAWISFAAALNFSVYARNMALLGG